MGSFRFHFFSHFSWTRPLSLLPLGKLPKRYSSIILCFWITLLSLYRVHVFSFWIALNQISLFWVSHLKYPFLHNTYYILLWSITSTMILLLDIYIVLIFWFGLVEEVWILSMIGGWKWLVSFVHLCVHLFFASFKVQFLHGSNAHLLFLVWRIFAHINTLVDLPLYTSYMCAL